MCNVGGTTHGHTAYRYRTRPPARHLDLRLFKTLPSLLEINFVKTTRNMIHVDY
jgi:hypothetical protein